jgi:hypothetical protein
MDALPTDERVMKAVDIVLIHMACPPSNKSLPSAPLTSASRRSFSFARPMQDTSVFRAEPGMSMSSRSVSYHFARMRQYFDCSEECYVISMVYIDRLVQNTPQLSVDSVSCHRLFLAGTILAVKYHDDVHHLNTHFAKVGGLDLKELNKLEATFLSMLRWRLHVEVKEFCFYRELLLAAVTSESAHV